MCSKISPPPRPEFIANYRMSLKDFNIEFLQIIKKSFFGHLFLTNMYEFLEFKFMPPDLF